MRLLLLINQIKGDSRVMVEVMKVKETLIHKRRGKLWAMLNPTMLRLLEAILGVIVVEKTKDSIN